MEKESKQRKTFITISGCLFLLYSFVNVNPVYMWWGRIVGVVFSVIFFVMGIGTLASIKGKNIATTFASGLTVVAHSILLLVYLIPLLFDRIFMHDILMLCIIGTRVACFVLLTMSSVAKQRNDKKHMWLIPALLQVIYIFCGSFSFHYWFFYRPNYIRFLLGEIIICLGIIFFSKAMSIQQNLIEDDISIKTTNTGYCDMTKHILLLVFVGWIWQYVWIYKVTDYLNKTPNEEKRNPETKLLLCMFVPFYYIYWIYQSARRIEVLAKEKNVDSDIVMLSTVLAIFVGIIPPILMQNKINQICKYEDKTTFSAETDAVDQKVETNSDKTEEIRNYKKLLDDGIITEEEFEAKKKQLLGL